jgi:hypothetical protein
MLTLEKARELAIAKVKDFENKSTVALALMDDATIEFEYGWMFFYQSEKYVKTGDVKALVGGNAPLIVDKFNSTVHVTGTRRNAAFYIKMYSQFRDQPDKFKEEIR